MNRWWNNYNYSQLAPKSIKGGEKVYQTILITPIKYNENLRSPMFLF